MSNWARKFTRAKARERQKEQERAEAKAPGRVRQLSATPRMRAFLAGRMSGRRNGMLSMLAAEEARQKAKTAA